MIATLLVFRLDVAAAQTTADETTGVDTTEAKQPPASAEPVTAAPVATDKATTADKAPEPISGAFGIPLGKLFEASMAAKVIDEQPQSYRGADGVELKGRVIRFEPSQPDKRFQRYVVKTTGDGIIYAIQADYQFELDASMSEQGKEKRSRKLRKTCKNAVKALARDFEEHYGKPRGKGWDGEWFAFRQLSDTSNNSLRLYGNRCRSGIYSMVMTDEKVQRGAQAEKESSETQPEKAGTDKID